MSLERLREIMQRFRDQVASGTRGGVPRFGAGAKLGLDLLESMLLARHLDLAAHELRARGLGHYTIASSGHESNVVLGRLTRVSDPTLVHYRSAAFVLERARQAPDVDMVMGIALSLVASAEEPTSGGRHKVFGSRPLGIIPQTSTIASHLPRALGLAYALELKERLGLAADQPSDAIVVVGFGDASVNHSTALGSLNAASWTLHQNLKLPLLFVCEDNGIGISVRTPPDWVEARMKALPHIEYFATRGEDLDHAFATASKAVEYCRRSRKSAVLHLKCVRLLGHAGSDVDTSYRSSSELADAIERDPVKCHALGLLASGEVEPATILALDDGVRARVARATAHAISRPKLVTREQVLETLALPLEPRDAPIVHASLQPAERLTLAQGINRMLAQILERQPQALVFGEDVAKKGGVYGLTKGLFERFGGARVFNTLLDEQTILGLALGASTLGLLPIPEIQYLAYLHNAEDQLRGEASSMRFFSLGAFDNPMILRVAGLAYQTGFGGHFHNDNSLAVVRDIPGVVVAIPARADDAVAIYSEALRLSLEQRRVVVVIEPIALYHRRDLYEGGDGEWLADASAAPARVGRTRVYGEAPAQLLIATYGNGVYLALRAKKRLESLGITTRILDLRFVVPLPVDDVLAHARQASAVLVVDECRRSGNLGEALVGALRIAGFSAAIGLVAAADSFIPLGDAAELVLVSESEIVEGGVRLCKSTQAQTAGDT